MLNRRNHEVAPYDPFREMERMERNFFERPFSFFGENALTEFKTDITDEGTSYKLQADLPGFEKKDIHLDVEDDTLTISAERHSEHEEKDKQGKYLRCERSYGSYYRRFGLADVDSANIKAKYENGVLTLTLPKKQIEAPKSTRLEIE